MTQHKTVHSLDFHQNPSNVLNMTVIDPSKTLHSMDFISNSSNVLNMTLINPSKMYKQSILHSVYPDTHMRNVHRCVISALINLKRDYHPKPTIYTNSQRCPRELWDKWLHFPSLCKRLCVSKMWSHTYPKHAKRMQLMRIVNPSSL